MDWWAWVVGGAILLGAELFFVDAQFYLVFVGTAAIVTGIGAGAWPGLAVWAQWAGFALLSVVAMFTFRRRIYERLRGRAPGVRSGPQGDVLTLGKALSPGEECQQEHAGSFWTLRNGAGAALPAGARIRVERVDGMTLLVVSA
jgi:membrane protein implicated in regulation of membrane protease activity